ncbi:NYN domain-containing protein, partial [Patescibacteria group bacterium]|nr:NYN domain-containing protein [Patescibacteria group bacterium]
DDFRLKLRGKTAVYIDWANVHGWKKSLKKEVDPKKLFKELKYYQEIKKIIFYYGLDRHPKSNQFLNFIRRIGFNVISKDVKYIPVSLDTSHFKNLAKEIKNSLVSVKNLKTEDIEKILQILSRKVLQRKCDFDIEIALDCFEHLNKHDSFIFLSGDGDFEPLYKMLIKLHKQVIVIYAHGHLGREVWNMKKGIYKRAVDALGIDLFIKNAPPVSRGA